MKKATLILIAVSASFMMSAQTSPIPDVDLRDINGNIISSTKITESGSPTLLVFWKSSGGKCCDNLELLQEAWEVTLRQHGVKLVAICVDCNGSWTQVKPIVNGKGWEFDTYIDVNGDLKRALSVGEAPCTMLFDENQVMVCRYNSACTGSQDFICNNIMDHLNLSVTADNFTPGK